MKNNRKRTRGRRIQVITDKKGNGIKQIRHNDSHAAQLSRSKES